MKEGQSPRQVHSGMWPGQSPPRGGLSHGSHLFRMRKEARLPTYILPCVYPGSHPTGQEASPHATDGAMTPFPNLPQEWEGPSDWVRANMAVELPLLCSEG